jgi:hypothetical protein
MHEAIEKEIEVVNLPMNISEENLFGKIDIVREYLCQKCGRESNKQIDLGVSERMR